MESRGKGTVTSLSSLFSAEKAQKAAQCVKDNITEKYMLDNLHSFVNDNTNLINLVNRLPDELHHQIMVPFGKAAFFPGRLVHTNEFMVLLGEGYFAERSAKQAADILKRRGNMLDSEVDSLKSVIKDLKTEASFFDKTAEEAAVYLEIPNGEQLADAIDSKGVPYIIFWQSSFSCYAASHLRHALFSVLQSSPCHTWDAFQLAHASFRLYCIRNNSMLPVLAVNSGKQNQTTLAVI